MDHFFCEFPTLLRLSCADTSFFQDLIYACCVVMLLLPLWVIVASYAWVLTAVTNMTSAEGKQGSDHSFFHLAIVPLPWGSHL